MNFTLTVIAVLVLAVLASIARAFGIGRAVERSEAGRERAEAEAAAAASQLDMHAEAARIDRETATLLEDELDEELRKWSAPDR